MAESLLLQEAAPEHMPHPPLQGSTTRRLILGETFIDPVTLNCVGCLGRPRPAALGAWPNARGRAEVLGGVEGWGRGRGGAGGWGGAELSEKGPAGSPGPVASVSEVIKGFPRGGGEGGRGTPAKSSVL